MTRRGQWHFVTEFGMTRGAGAHCYLAWTLCIQGFAEQSKDMLERAQGIGCGPATGERESTHAPDLALCPAHADAMSRRQGRTPKR